MRTLFLSLLIVVAQQVRAGAPLHITGAAHCALATTVRPNSLETEDVGTVVVRVEDEFTYFAEGQPLVAGAYVMLYDPVTMMVFADGTTGPTGTITFTGVPAGAIRCAASAPNHASASLLSAVPANQSSTLSIFLPGASTVPDPPFYVDADGDGYPAAQDGVSPSYDCNDNDPSVHPGAIEICGDGVDNDCDGAADELHSCFADPDNDGFGDAAMDTIACTIPPGYVTNSLDQCPGGPEPGTPCDDGSACTTNDVIGADCQCAGTPLNCDDGNPCTLDACDPQFGCQHVPLPDGTACGANAQCQSGTCVIIVDTDGDGVPDASDNCPTVPGQVGTVCDDGDPDTFLSVLNGGCLCEVVPQAGDYRSITSGAWESAATWEVYSGVQFLPASAPPNAAANWITIRSGHSVSIASAVTTDQTIVQAGASLSISSTLSLNDGTGDDLRVKGSLSSTGTLNGPGSVVIRSGGSFTVPSGTFGTTSVVNMEAGSIMNKTGNGFLNIGGFINNGGTCNMNGGVVTGNQNGPTTFNNLAGGVININNWRLEALGWSSVNVYNAGTINKNAGPFARFSISGRFQNLPGGTVNVNSGILQISPFGLVPELTDQRGVFNVLSGTTLQLSSNFGFRFLGNEINNNGSLFGGELRFLGTSPQILSGTGSINDVIMDAPGGVILQGTQSITSSLTLTNGSITLSNYDLVLDGVPLYGGSAGSYLITGGTGCLRRTVPAGGNTYYPVGTTSSFAPATLNLDASSTTDAYRVRVNSGVSTTYDANDAPSGTPITSAALQHAWFVRDLVSGGTNASLLLQWNAQDEAPGFTRNACRIARNDGSAWDVTGDAAASGSGPYTLQRNGITDLGAFTVLGGVPDLCPGGPEPGTACDDNNAGTINDVIGSNCQCAGTPLNCDDGNPCTLDLNDPLLGCIHTPVPDGTACGSDAVCLAGSCELVFVDTDGDGTSDGNDCAPNDPAVHPGAAEICNGNDDDCDGQVDEGTGATWYYDNDADGFGVAETTLVACDQPIGFVAAPGDCNDNDAAINPMAYDACPDGIDNNCNGLVDEQASMVGQPCSSTIGACQQGVWGCVGNVLTCVGGTLPSAEICSDGIDNDCDGQVDEITPETVPLTWYLDFDGDGYGSPDTTSIVHSCDPQPGYALNGNDCNDNNAAINPGATELCNGLDDNCDGNVESGPIVAWYADVDGDGFGDAAVEVLTCIQPVGFVSVAGDCNVQDPGIHPGAPEVCNGLDDDCDGAIDGLDPDAVLATWYLDADGDGSGSPADTVIACAPPTGYVAQGTDCDDSDPNINPTAYDACPDGVDNNCNGQIDEQAAMIGQPCGSSVGQCIMGTWGCANNVLTCIGGVAASAEICSDGIDNDCDGQVDEITPETVPLTWYVDSDADGFGNPDTSLIVLSCDPQPGYAISAGDCKDQDPNIHPARPEVCNGIDDNCNGLVDEGIPAHYADADGDGLGDPAQPVACTTPGAVTNNSDCDDSDPVPCGTVVMPQLVERNVIGSTGTASEVGTVRVEWTLGEPVVTTIEDQGLRLTQGFHQSPALQLRLNLRALLQGPFVSPAYGMNDSLRTRGLIPLEEPYTALGYVHVGGGGEATSAPVLSTSGPDAIVDWIVVELRAPSTPDVVMASRAGLLQRDGDIVDVDGTSPLAFKAPSAGYRVAVIHRNHLPVITATPASLSTVATAIDLTDGSTALYGTEPVRVEGSLHMLWCGDVNGDGTIRYTGAQNDRDPILVGIGGVIPTNTASGYAPEDVNMDGTTKYTGSNNDRDPILLNIGGTVPTNVRNAQMP